MGQAPRPRPARLAEKLRLIRVSLGLSQNELIKRLGVAEKITRERISAYELGEREPSLPVLLAYSRVANVWMDVIVDDDLDLPEKLPSAKKHEGIPRNPRSARTRENK